MALVTYAAHPTGEDLQAFLEGNGFELSAALISLLEGAAAAAATDFGRAAERVMLAEATATARTFDPPTGPHGKLWVDDLAAAPTLVEYVPAGSTAVTLTLAEDYWLKPDNALAKGQPLTQLQFRRRWSLPLAPSLLQSLRVTGRWGYGTRLPADVWQAELMRGAYNVWAQMTFSETGGLLGWKNADRSEDYGVERWTGPLKLWCGDNGSGGVFGRTAAQYRRMSL